MPFDGPLAAQAVHALERIADALEQLLPAETASEGCTHPESERDHTNSTMGRPRWTCGVCGYQFEAATSAARG